MKYFKFLIPTMPDGSRILYSPGWHGTTPKACKDVEVLLYNDKEGYGIARTKDLVLSKEFEVLEEAEALGELSKLMDSKDEAVFMGDRLYSKWVNLQPRELSVEDSIKYVKEVLDGEPIQDK